MAAEFFLKFSDASWYERNVGVVAAAIRKLPSFVGEEDQIFLLRGEEDAAEPWRWKYDVRIFLSVKPPALLEISARPPSIGRDLAQLLRGLRLLTPVVVEDEDSELGGW